jgi:hypothetical protein
MMDRLKQFFGVKEKPSLEARINNHTSTAEQRMALSCHRIAEYKLKARDASRRGNPTLARQYAKMIVQEEQQLNLLTSTTGAVNVSRQTLETAQAMKTSVDLTRETVKVVKKTGVPKIRDVNRVSDQLQDIKQNLTEVGETFDGFVQLNGDEEDHVDELISQIEDEHSLEINRDLSGLPSIPNSERPPSLTDHQYVQETHVKTDPVVLSDLFPDPPKTSSAPSTSSSTPMYMEPKSTPISIVPTSISITNTNTSSAVGQSSGPSTTIGSDGFLDDLGLS